MKKEQKQQPVLPVVLACVVFPTLIYAKEAIVTLFAKCKKRQSAPALFLFVSISTLVTTTFAAKNYSVHLSIDAAGRWDSNYYSSVEDETAVYSYLLSPAVKFNYQTDKTFLGLRLSMDPYTYSSTRDQDISEGQDIPDDFIGYTMEFDAARSTESHKLTFGLSDKLYFSRNPEHIGEVENSASRELYTINTFNPSILYNLSRLKLNLGYTNIITDYDQENQENTVQHNGRINAYYKFNRTLEFGPEFAVESIDYDKGSPEYDGREFSGVLRRNGKFFDLVAALGYHTRDVDDGTKLEDITWRLTVTSQPTGFKKTNFSVSLVNNMNNKTYERGYYTSLDEYRTYAEGYYSALQLNGHLGRKLSRDLTLNLDASMQWDEHYYPSSGDAEWETADLWRVGGGLTYMLTKGLQLALSARYQHTTTQYSNYIIDEDVYDNTSCMIQLKYTL